MVVVFKFSVIFLAIVVMLGGGSGCSTSPATNSSGNVPAKASPIWLERELKVEGMSLNLGERDPKDVEGFCQPVVTITKEGKPVADAMVFVQLVTADGKASQSEEVATVYTEAGGTSIYESADKLRLPQEGSATAIRYRVILAGVETEWTKDVVLPRASTAKTMP